jgi:alkylhydroperoxidase family enzyme
VTFLTVYVREAHPTDGWRSPSNDKVGISVAQPTTVDDRIKVAGTCGARLEITMPLLVDALDDRVGHAYSGMPDRLYIIDTAGRVAYKAGRGPFGFKPAEMEQSLIMLLLDAPPPKAAPKTSAHVPLLDNATAWKHLPIAEKGMGAQLPAWARATAEVLPRTTAAMLELDFLHRAASPLPPRLRGMMRWSAAHANRCAFTEAQALADLRRAGVETAAIDALRSDRNRLSPVEQAAVEFARKLTSAAFSVTDAEMADLIKTHGEKQVVAMVQLLAHANFQDRLILALGVSAAEPLPPRQLVFGKTASADRPQAPPRQLPSTPRGPRPASRITDAEWLAFDFAALQQKLAGQRARAPRIRVPSWEEFLKENPKAPASPLRIRWSLVCSGYQPALGQAWSACTRAFGEEARQDRVFEEMLFWVVTRSLNCFY